MEYWFFGLACVSNNGNDLIAPPLWRASARKYPAPATSPPRPRRDDGEVKVRSTDEIKLTIFDGQAYLPGFGWFRMQLIPSFHPPGLAPDQNRSLLSRGLSPVPTSCLLCLKRCQSLFRNLQVVEDALNIVQFFQRFDQAKHRQGIIHIEFNILFGDHAQLSFIGCDT